MQKTQDKKGMNKPLKFIIALLAFLVTAVLFTEIGAGGCFLITRDIDTDTDSDTTQSESDTTQSKESESCDYDDNTYQHGENFEAIDDCNVCLCSDGEVVCTDVSCEVVEDETTDSSQEKPKTIDVEGLEIVDVFQIIKNETGQKSFYPSLSNLAIKDNTVSVYKEYTKYADLEITTNDGGIISISSGHLLGLGGRCTQSWTVETEIGNFGMCEWENEGPWGLLDTESDEFNFLVSFDSSFSDSDVESFLKSLKKV